MRLSFVLLHTKFLKIEKAKSLLLVASVDTTTMADTLPAQKDVNKDNNNDAQRGRRQTGKAIIVVVGAGSKHIIHNTATDTTTSDVARWGLGGALAVPFAEEGYNIVLMGRRKEVLEEVQQSIELVHQQWWNDNNNNNGNGDAAQQQQQPQKEEEQPQPPKVLSVRCDVTDDTSVRQAFQDVSKNVGPFFPPESYIDLIIFNDCKPLFTLLLYRNSLELVMSA